MLPQRAAGRDGQADNEHLRQRGVMEVGWRGVRRRESPPYVAPDNKDPRLKNTILSKLKVKSLIQMFLSIIFSG